MNQGKTVFAQLMSVLPYYEFNKCVDRYKGNYRVRSFDCRQHFYVMGFAQLSYRESLREIETCLQCCLLPNLNCHLHQIFLNNSLFYLYHVIMQQISLPGLLFSWPYSADRSII